MPVPTDYIFTPGTCLKKDFYDVLCAALIGAGWSNVTSNYATDGDVFASTGNTEDKSLIINLRKSYNGGATGDVTTSDSCFFGFRLPSSYTPGSEGNAGTFGRAEEWRRAAIVPTYLEYKVAMGTTFYYKIYVDKNKIIFSIEYPPGAKDIDTGTNWNGQPMLTYIGLPDTLGTTEQENRGVLFCSTHLSAGVPGITSNSVYIGNSPLTIGDSADSYNLPVYSSPILTNPNSKGDYAIAEVYYGSTSEGIRGKLDGVLYLPSSNVRTGMHLQVGSHVYYVLNANGTAYQSQFPTKTVAIRIS